MLNYYSIFLLFCQTFLCGFKKVFFLFSVIAEHSLSKMLQMFRPQSKRHRYFPQAARSNPPFTDQFYRKSDFSCSAFRSAAGQNGKTAVRSRRAEVTIRTFRKRNNGISKHFYSVIRGIAVSLLVRKRQSLSRSMPFLKQLL